jgi:hypothetical protein
MRGANRLLEPERQPFPRDLSMPNSLSTSVVVDFGSTKQAALFFDHVITLDGVEGVSGAPTLLACPDSPIDVERARSIVLQLLPTDFGTDEQVAEFASVAAIGISAIQVAGGFYNCDEMTQKANGYGAKLLAPASFHRYTADTAVTVDSDVGNAEAGNTSRAERALVSVAGILVPDTQELSWDAIIELRKDPVARQRLRRLRVFAAKEYAGKSRTFMEDDLSVRVEDYEETLKTWGIKTALGTLSTCLTLQTTLQALFVDAVGVLSGLPPGAALATSLAVPLGRFVVELGTIRLAREEAIRQYPLAYIADVKKRSK